MSEYQYTNDWFGQNCEKIWNVLLPKIKPQRILEVGSFEGRSICHMIKLLDGPLEIHAIDSWAGGKDIGSTELMKINPFTDVEARFQSNTKKAIEESGKEVKLNVHKYTSDIGLSRLLIAGYRDYFDFVYLDGSHETMDTLCDLILSYKLVREGGVIGVDDYLWLVNHNPIFRPKVAIDTFINLNLHRTDMIQCDNAQVYFVKRNHLDENCNYLPVVLDIKK